MLQFSRDKLSLINLPLSCYAILPVDFHLPIKQVISYVVLHGSTIFLLLTMPYLGAHHHIQVREYGEHHQRREQYRPAVLGLDWLHHNDCKYISSGFSHHGQP